MAIRLSGLVSGMDTESMVSELMKAQSGKKTKLENKITTTEWKQDKWKDLNKKIYDFYTGSMAKLRLQSSFNTKAATSTNESLVTVEAGNTATKGTHLIQVGKLASAQFLTGTKLNGDIDSNPVTTDTLLTDMGVSNEAGNSITVQTASGSKTLTIGNDTTVGDFLDTLKSTSLNASFDTAQKRFFISSKDNGTSNAFSITSAGTVDMTALGLSTITYSDDGSGNLTYTQTGSGTLVQASDAKFKYNNAEMTSTSNTVTVNGLTLKLKGVTAGYNTASADDDETVTVGVAANTEAVYSMVKDFVKNYNELLSGMKDAYYANSAKGYEPLTDDQKKTMTDDQVTKWEGKIKDSLLRRDGTLGSLMDTLRSGLSKSVTLDSKSYSLATYGISTSVYTEKGTLHIDGDSDESLVGTKDNLLKKALEEDPDTVAKVISDVVGGLYSSLTDKMKSNSMRSALTLYNDKELTSTLKSYKSSLTSMEDKLTDMENKYYKQFSAMETAMSKVNAQSSSLSSLLGMNS